MARRARDSSTYRPFVRIGTLLLSVLVLLATARAGICGSDHGTTASCVLLLQPAGSPSGQPNFDLGSLTALTISTQFIEAAAKEALGLPPQEWRKALQVSTGPAGRSGFTVIVTLIPGGPTPLPPEAADKMVNELARRVILVQQRMNGTPCSEHASRLEKLNARRAELVTEVSSIKSKLSPKSQTSGGMEREWMAQRHRERPRMESEILEREARLKVLQEALSETPPEEKERSSSLRSQITSLKADIAAFQARVQAILLAKAPEDAPPSASPQPDEYALQAQLKVAEEAQRTNDKDIYEARQALTICENYPRLVRMDQLDDPAR